MNYLSKIILASFPFLSTATVFAAYMMDSGRMNSEQGYEDSSRQNYYERLQAQADRTYPQRSTLDSTPIPQEERFYRYPSHPVISPDPHQPRQFNQDVYPYEETDYDNKNRRWAYADNNRPITQWVTDSNQNVRQYNPVSDEGISQNIRHTIMRDPDLRGIAKSIEVTVNRGNVILAGSVKTKAEKNKIDYIANSTDGVKSVLNKITISNQ